MPEPEPNYCAFCGKGLRKQSGGGIPSFDGNKLLTSIDVALNAKGSPNDRLKIDSSVEGYWIGYCDQCNSNHGISNRSSITGIADQMQFNHLVEATR